MFSGQVVSIRHSSDPRENAYYILGYDSGVSEEKVSLIECGSSLVLNVGEYVSAEIAEGSIKKFFPLSERAAAELKSRIDEGVRSFVKSAASHAFKSGISDLDNITSKMEAKLHAAAALLLWKLAYGAPVVVRFHNDADGASGAYAVHIAAKHVFENGIFAAEPRIVWHMHRSIAYGADSAFEDEVSASAYDSVEKPLLIIIDFGTSPDSNAGIERALKKFDIIWLDHHPVVEGFSGATLEHYINPWLFGGDSNYTAGFLACAFSSILSSADYSAIYDASLIGDYSTYAKHTAEGNDLAIILDLITSDRRIAYGDASGDITPQLIEKIMYDVKRKAELLGYAKMRLSEAMDLAVARVKEYKSRVANVYLLDFNEIRGDDEGRYPLPGRFASKVFEHMEKLSDRSCVVILHFNLFISIRASYDVDALSIVNTVAGEYSTIESAGGHRNACSIKLKDEQEKRSIINSILRRLGVEKN
ncbi:MAG: hypothetical protein ACP5TK_01975 [Candidatus Micrarchaeia archaeon]